MLISRLCKLNLHLKNFKKNDFLLISRLNKLFVNFYSTPTNIKFEKIQNITYEKNKIKNEEKYFSSQNQKFKNMERIILYLDDYTFKCFDENFYSLLQTFYKNFLFISKTQCNKISNLSSTITKIKSKLFQFYMKNNSFQSINQAKGILYFIYVLEKKNIYNITRDENNFIIPQIVKYFEENHNKISLADLLEITQISVHFGITIDLRLIESRLNKEINSVGFDIINHIVRNLRDHKYNKLNYYKTRLINMIKEYYIELGLKEKISNKLSLLSNLSSISIEFPTLDMEQDLFKILLNLQKEFLVNDNTYDQLDQYSINYLLESFVNLQMIQKKNLKDFQLDILIKSNDFERIVHKLYDHVSNNMLYFDREKVNSVSDRNKRKAFNFPLFLLFIKNLSSIEKELLPKEEHLKIFFKFVSNNLPLITDVHREAIFCFKLMKRTSFMDDQLAENLRKYLIDHIHIMNVEKYPLSIFKETFENIYQKDKKKFHENILKPLNENVFSFINFSKSKNKPIFLFRLFLTRLSFSEIDLPDVESQKLFNKFLISLRQNPKEFLLKEYYKLLEYLAINTINLNKNYAEVFYPKLISFLNENRDNYVILDLTSTRIIVYLEILDIKEKTFDIKEKLIHFILEFKANQSAGVNFLKIFNELRMLAENNINIHNNTIDRISNLINEKNLRLNEDQLENFLMFIYIFLKNSQKTQKFEEQKKYISTIEKLLSSIDIKIIDYHSPKINISSTLGVLSKILHLIINFSVYHNKLLRIYEDLKLAQIRKNKL